MANATVSAPTLEEFAAEHSNTLYDVVALLDAAADRIEAASLVRVAAPSSADSAHNTLRLVQMALEKVKTVADLMLAGR
mgnify:CR=1 FL=1|jgi:predicted negative regulator of RcsB-dependent stress response